MIDAPDPTVLHQVGELTPAERTVAVLIGNGLTIPEIADELHRTRSAVKRHVEHIHLKLRTCSLVMIATWVTRTGLVDHPEWYDEAGRFVGRPAA